MKRDLPAAPVAACQASCPPADEDLLAECPFAYTEPMPSPAALRLEQPASSRAMQTVIHGRRVLRNILDRRDPRPMVVVGPCSIHDPVAGRDYAQRLKQLADELADSLYLVMRVYFEKPRSCTGWKGLINDPHLDASCRIADGMREARRFLLDVADLGLPAATEVLDPLSPQYLGELLSWAAIGARTAESQIHREIASALPMPIGFKNGTDGGLDAAVNAIVAASRPHSFLGLDASGQVAIVRTQGNRLGHAVLRGGGGKPNYDAASVALARNALQKAGLVPSIVVDCSHGNSSKDHARQKQVLQDVVTQWQAGEAAIVGVMIESFIEAGNQPLLADPAQLRYGCSITDACVSWADTETMLREAAQALRQLR